MSEAPFEISFALKADFARSDMKRGLVWFLNYAALDPTAVKSSHLDLHGSAMLPHDVEKFAHRWLAFSRSVDVQHDGVGRDIRVVESFFNSPEVCSPNWPVNSHALRLDVANCAEAMDGLRKGTLNSVSLDALTFNRKVRLPAAVGKSASAAGAPSSREWVPPSTAKDWATDLARLGFEGVTTVRTLGSGLFVAERSVGLPIGIEVTDGDVEVTPAGGVWARLSAVLCQSGTLTAVSLQPGGDEPLPHEAVVHKKSVFQVDFAPNFVYDSNFDHDESPFAVIVNGQGLFPHHSMNGDVSMSAVRAALESVKSMSGGPRATAEAHLMGHLRARS